MVILTVLVADFTCIHRIFKHIHKNNLKKQNEKLHV